MIGVFVGSLLGAMGLGIPIAFALLVSSVVLMYFLGIFDSQIIAQNLISGADNFPLMAIPFFMLAGEAMNRGGLSRRIVEMAMNLVGHIKGGLGYVAIIASVLFASLSGSAVADTAALGAILIPMMVKSGYDVNRSSGLIASGGIIAPIIPPSIGFIIFGVASGVSITKLFMAGIVPGILLAVGLTVTWAIVARKDKVAVNPRASTKEILTSLRQGVWALFLPVIIIGGLKFGLFTPTEAAVVAAVYAIFVGLVIYREMKVKDLYEVFVHAGKMTSVVMFLVAAALVSSWLITVADLPGQVIGLLEPFMDHPFLLLIMINLLVIVVGTAMDMTPTILILTPVLMPLVVAAGIDPVYFGVLFILNNAIGLLTPPVGTVLNVMCGISKISMEDIMKGIWPFLLVEVIVLILLILFPSLVLVPLEWFTS
ncbi:TRAP transporter large permease subunit [Peribacillus frigoritolerans]|jgi:tripartite ATP-independent transporter DctM subunit|uniref:TRAP transporter large permease n=1 Tax=Peribacillus TaxID=2675229 RepID=UPI0007BF95CF|nr:TRAP transporter large permease subunit [Peribacillus frigoritolerans]PHD77670.1 L-dehydroascorbate transporter large permease subunit [Bacillus sp. AFS043905]PRS36412.1 L-dehydroascorbate transporter large permease subunit [Bacillus sp. RJGP41]QNK47335.1 TRAP transporter large permease subunit [Brevibacterium sp. PAMC23299]MCU6600005.1 TRAP transporter large permease subunit [Peribacillus frigoritolerans]MCY9002332.1 TRAP transporter large permease subunit [Peribacillus frigoritolerans]